MDFPSEMIKTPKIDSVMASQFCGYTKKPLNSILYWFIWYVNYISTKMLKSKDTKWVE